MNYLKREQFGVWLKGSNGRLGIRELQGNKIDKMNAKTSLAMHKAYRNWDNKLGDKVNRWGELAVQAVMGGGGPDQKEIK